MATKNKKDTVADLLANINTNTTKDITAVRVQAVISDFTNSISFNVTVAQLQAEDDSAVHSLANIIDIGRQGVFQYDPLDVVSADDGGGGCIVTSSNKRYKRIVHSAIDARWYGQLNYYFPDTATALAAVKAITRFVGLKITIVLNGSPVEYWFKGGILDANLVVKTSETFPIDFTIGDGGGMTPNDGDIYYVNPVLTADKTILSAFINGAKTKVVLYPAVSASGNVYFQFDPANTRFIMKNGVFTDPNDYSILYK